MTEASETARGRTETVELSARAQTVARRVAESKATVPHLYLQSEVDMTRAMGQLSSAPDRPGSATVDDVVIRACGLALREHSRVNGSYRDGRLELHSRINVGFSVSAQDAFVLPTVFDADSKGLARIAEETRRLASRARDGSITPPELSGGTFSVANLGMFGITNFQPVISPPQAAILAVGEMKARPVVTDDGSIEPRQIMGLSLACDHRILSGADAARFLAGVRALLEEPSPVDD